MIILIVAYMVKKHNANKVSVVSKPITFAKGYIAYDKQGNVTLHSF